MDSSNYSVNFWGLLEQETLKEIVMTVRIGEHAPERAVEAYVCGEPNLRKMRGFQSPVDLGRR